ncbi:MAG: hypothetical protein ACOYOK_06185 [Pseudobdellovibrionaceae bacterium]
MNPIPPQAYTKDTLLKAYSWLMNQNTSIKEMASTPDVLVSLYLKATRDGDSVLDRPSIQNFKKELKNLAGLMGSLEKSHVSVTMHSMTEQVSSSSASLSAASMQNQEVEHGYVNGGAHKTQGKANESMLPPQQSTFAEMPTVLEDTDHKNILRLLEVLDEESLSLLRSVKKDLNLSHEGEALRLLIKMGYSKAQQLLK